MPKKEKKFHKPKLVASLVIIIVTFIAIFFLPSKPGLHTSNSPQTTPKLTPTPTVDLPFDKYIPPKISHKPFYTIAMIGDSMTFALGIHGGKLSEYLNTLYESTPGHQRIIIDNYAIGSTNILDANKQMTTKRTVSDVTLEPLVSVKPDLILIESFGYNPLSQLGLTNGLKTQTETLNKTMKFLTTKLPKTAIMFVATIAPNKETYAENEQPGSTLADREAQAQERIMYIKNHMSYAKLHQIPLIDIYDKSITPEGDGKSTYIDPADHIHPSFAGIDFIDHEIANYIYANQILPK